MVSSKGKGLISDNTLKGSMHVCNECHARLGENRVSGVCDVDTNNNTTIINSSSNSNNSPQPIAQSVYAK